MDPARPRRSLLFAPASNARALEKLRLLDCDGVVIDLEDSVAPEAKTEARTAAMAAIAQGFPGKEVVLRCNGLDSSWAEEDLKAAAASGADAVLIPKVQAATDIAAVEAALFGAPKELAVWVMIETARAVASLEAIAAEAASGRLAGLVLGPNDLALELRLRPGPGRASLQPILSRTVVAARANGLVALDGVFNAIEDEAGLEAECRQAAEFGFDGKTLIHPRQIDPCNRAFSPSPQELAWARAVVEAFDAPEAAGKGAIRLQGRMIERLHLAEAERTLRLAAV